MRYFLTLFVSLFILLGLAACGSSLPVLKPYKMDIQQGNVITSKMLLQLKPGMTKSQVRFILGTPLIVDSFHKDRWDYFYQMRQAGKVIEQRRVILTFEKDLLQNVRGDVVPQGTAGADTGESAAKTIVMPEKKPEEKSWTEKLKFWKKDETPEAKPVQAKPAETKPEDKAVEAPKAPESAADTPSVLAVPVEIVPPVVAPQVEAPQTEAPKAETEPVRVEPAPVPVTPVEPPKPAPIKPAPTKPMPSKPAMKQDEKMIFRLDRTLKHELLEQPVPVEPPAAEQPAAAPKPKKNVVEEPLPPETEPSFFDKMLEKIGF